MKFFTNFLSGWRNRRLQAAETYFARRPPRRIADIQIVRRNDGNGDGTASFEVFLQRTDSGTQAVETFLREGLTISGQHYLREPGVLAIIKAGDNALGNLLGDAENPAHTRWERGGKHFRGRYGFGPSVLIYVQRSAQHLCALLSRRPEGVDKDLLQHLFSVPEPGQATSTGPKPEPGPVVPPIVPTVKPPNYFVECSRIHGGFHLRPHPKAVRAPAAIQLRAAYEVVRGNPFRLHHPADFDFTKSTGLDLEFAGLTVANATPKRSAIPSITRSSTRGASSPAPQAHLLRRLPRVDVRLFGK